MLSKKSPNLKYKQGTLVILRRFGVPQKMYCQNCGAEISPTDKYCPSCGAAQQAPDQPQQQPYAAHSQPQTQPQPQTDMQPNKAGMFNQNKYTIEQKLVALRDTYGVKDLNGNLLGYVKQKLSAWDPNSGSKTPTASNWER